MEQRVSISISDGIADVRLVRADKMNALDAAMFEALVAATERLAHEKVVRGGAGVLRRPRHGTLPGDEGTRR
jgi:enoyl-CoA hydratase/carnithine racemase